MATDCSVTYSTYSTLNKLLDIYLYFTISIDFTFKVFIIQYEYCTRTLQLRMLLYLIMRLFCTTYTVVFTYDVHNFTVTYIRYTSVLKTIFLH